MSGFRAGTKLLCLQSQCQQALRQVGTRPLRIRQVQTHQENRGLQVQWEDGTVGHFSYVWLRDSAPTHRPESLNDLNLKIKPKELKLTDQGDAVLIEWPPYLKAQYTSDWLRDHLLPSADNILDQPGTQCWIKSSKFKAPTFNFETIRDDEGGRALLMSQYHKVGIAKVKACGELSPDELLDLVPVGFCEGKQIASLDDVVRKVHELHSGFPELATIPKVVAMKVKGINGYGSFQLVDGFAVAQQFRETHRRLFDFLADTPVQYEGIDDLTTAKHPTIVLDAEEHIKQVVFNNVQRSTRLNLSMAQSDLFFQALKAFNNLLYKNAVNLKMGNGDILLINNNRVLHGHTAFAVSEENECKIEETYYN